MADLGKRIRQVRKQKLRMSQTAFGQELGVSATAVGKWERGDNAISAANLARLAVLAGVSEHWLKTGEFLGSWT